MWWCCTYTHSRKVHTKISMSKKYKSCQDLTKRLSSVLLVLMGSDAILKMWIDSKYSEGWSPRKIAWLLRVQIRILCICQVVRDPAKGNMLLKLHRQSSRTALVQLMRCCGKPIHDYIKTSKPHSADNAQVLWNLYRLLRDGAESIEENEEEE